MTVTALIAASLAWWLRGRVQQPDPPSAKQPVAAEQSNGQQEGPKQEHAEEGIQPIITILAEAPGLAPEEMEALVAGPIESQVNGVSGVQCVRSASRQGTCSVWVDLQVEPGGESAQLQIRVKREQAARYGAPVADLSMVVEMGLQGRVVGEVLDEGRRLDLVVMYDEKLRRSPEAIRELLVGTATGEAIPLDLLAEIVVTEGPVTHAFFVSTGLRLRG